MPKNERCFCGSGKASENSHRVASDSRAAHLFKIYELVETKVETYFKHTENSHQCF